MKKKIVAIEEKTKSGKIKELPIGHRHKELPEKGHEGKRGFIDSDGKVEKRKEAEKTAKKAGQIKPGHEQKKLHSSDLKACKSKK